jgi:uncharacterized protein with GYD domain
MGATNEGDEMPKYLLEINYSAEGIKWVLDNGGAAREKAGRAVVESAGGKLESFFFAFGGTDAYAICDLPDNTAAAALAMTISASGVTTARTAVLLTPAEVDAASKTTVDYSPPKG